jgi:endothelin-converting enzyme/putative endopeptidase
MNAFDANVLRDLLGPSRLPVAALDICNSCDVEQANPDDPAGYCDMAAKTASKTTGHAVKKVYDPGRGTGRHYDAQGNLSDWWTAQDAKAFEARAAGLVRQYDAFVAVKDKSDPAKDVRVDGELTLGENTADNGGIRLAYDAFLATQGAKDGSDGLGYSPAQRFFLSYAQGWCEHHTEEAAKEDAKTDPHAPGKYRVNGVLMNMLPFREAFACKLGTPMAPATVHRVW